MPLLFPEISGRKPLYFVTSIVSSGNREGAFEWRLQSALGCDELTNQGSVSLGCASLWLSGLKQKAKGSPFFYVVKPISLRVKAVINVSTITWTICVPGWIFHQQQYHHTFLDYQTQNQVSQLQTSSISDYQTEILVTVLHSFCTCEEDGLTEASTFLISLIHHMLLDSLPKWTDIHG